MRSKSTVLETAVLGLLNDSPLHGYELRKRLNLVLGSFRALSYGSLYPCLKSLVERNWIQGTESVVTPHTVTSKRARIVYQLTADGKGSFASGALDATLDLEVPDLGALQPGMAVITGQRSGAAP